MLIELVKKNATNLKKKPSLRIKIALPQSLLNVSSLIGLNSSMT